MLKHIIAGLVGMIAHEFYLSFAAFSIAFSPTA